MKKERILLLLSAIFMIMYSLFQVVYIKFTNDRDTIMNTIIILISVLTVIFNFYCSFTNKNLDNFKIPIMIVSIYCFFMNIISGILGFIAYSKINHKEKRELPKIEIINSKSLIFSERFDFSLKSFFYRIQLSNHQPNLRSIII